MGKKICFVTTTSITLKTFVIDTAVMLHEKLGMDITFVCDNDERLSAMLPDYIHYHPITMKRGIDFSGMKSLSEMVKFFKKEQFDIVQYSTPNASLYASWAAKIAKVPVRLYAQWGIRYVGFEGMKRSIFKFIEKFVCSKSTTVHAVSPMNLEFAVEEGLYPKNKAKVLGIGGTIGVDLTEYPLEKKQPWREQVRKTMGIDAGFVFGFAGRLSRDKGGNELLTAMKRISDEGMDAALLIVGPDETEGDIDGELMNWAKSSGKVFFTGLLSKKDMPQYYSAMDVLVHPTYREGFGMVLQEAGAMQIPILTTRIPGASEVMEENVSCKLAEPRNVESLYQNIKELVKNPDVTIEMGIQARKRAEKYFDRPIMLNYQLEDYKELL
jgi:glycosyltransferase involved in cell wall biosynthesis